MREVTIRIMMLEPCLAGRKNHNVGNGPDFVFDRDSKGRALIMQTTWIRSLKFACKAISITTKHVSSVWFDPSVIGEVKTYDRLCKNQASASDNRRFMRYEAFLSGDVVTVRAVLHDKLWLSTFKKILKACGSYAGLSVSCFGDYGRFEVLSVR